MARENKSTVWIAVISAASAVAIALITTYGTIAISAPKVREVKQGLEDISDLQRIANLPMGTIVPSMLDPSAFAKEVGDPFPFDPAKSKWVLADGLVYIAASQYGKLVGDRTPDLRGMFLRGVNSQRKDGDPEDRKAGHRQEDALQQHGHETNATAFFWRDTSTDYGYKTEGDAHAPKANVMNVLPPARVADETRPKNVAVYFYIKIN